MKQLFSLLLLLSLFSCSPKETELPFELNGYIYIPVSIQGKEYPFLFDTGAAKTYLSAKLVEELNMNPIDSVAMGILIHRATRICSVYAQSDFNLGNLSVKSEFMSSPDNTLNIIGIDIISQLHWQFDFRTSQVKISKKEIPLDPLDSIRMILPYRETPTMSISILLNDSIHYDNTQLDTGLPAKGMHGEFVWYNTTSLYPLECELMNKYQGISGYNNSSKYRSMLLLSSSVNHMELAYPYFLFCTDSIFTRFEGFYMGLSFIANRFKIFNINPEKKEVTLTRRVGEDSTYIEQQKKTLIEMIELYKEEQKAMK